MVRETSCSAEMEFVDVSAIADAADSSSAFTYEDLEKLKSVEKEADYGTGELNQFVLDGSKEIVPSSGPDVAYWSEKSGEDCLFTNEQSITRTFSQPHTSSGITLVFADDYPISCRITWYGENGIKMDSASYVPNTSEYFCRKLVANYYGIKVEFLKTRLPFQYVKLQYIMHGQHLEWKSDYISSAKTTEEVDLTMATLSINKCSISILDTADDFNLEDDNGNWNAIQKTQPVSLYETVDGVRRNRGIYYIDSFSTAEKIITFDLIDGIGLMDNYTFDKGEIYTNQNAGELYDAIFDTCGIASYEIAENIRQIAVNGWLEVQTCREALQMLAFACGAVVDQNENGAVIVREATREVVNTVPTSRKFMDSSTLELSEYVSGVSIEYNTYSIAADESEVFKGELTPGTSKILFSNPVSPATLSISPSGEILSANTNYAIVKVESAAEYVISGKTYEEISNTLYLSVDEINANEKENVKGFGTLTLAPVGGYEQVAKKLLDYFSLRLVIKVKFLMDDEYVANWARIQRGKSKEFYAFFESLETDLVGGFISTASCRGYSKSVIESYYAGNELYLGQEGII